MIWRERSGWGEKKRLNILVSNKAKGITMHSIDYEAFNLEEFAGSA